MTRFTTYLASSAAQCGFFEQSKQKFADFAANQTAVLTDFIADPYYEQSGRFFTNLPVYFKYAFALNMAIFIAWRHFPVGFMQQHAMYKRENLFQGRFHTILTSNFSHIGFNHFFNNMICLLLVVNQLKGEFSERALWAVTILSCALVNLVPFCLDSWKLSVLRRNSFINARRSLKFDMRVHDMMVHGGGLGFSGVLCSLMYLLHWRRPNLNKPFSLQWTCDILGVALNLCFFFINVPLHSSIGHEAHLCGVLAGMVFRLLLEKSAYVRKKLRFGEEYNGNSILQKIRNYFSSLWKKKKEEKKYGELIPPFYKRKFYVELVCFVIS